MRERGREAREFHERGFLPIVKLRARIEVRADFFIGDGRLQSISDPIAIERGVLLALYEGRQLASKQEFSVVASQIRARLEQERAKAALAARLAALRTPLPGTCWSRCAIDTTACQSGCSTDAGTDAGCSDGCQARGEKCVGRCP